MSALRFMLFGFPRFERDGVQLSLARRRALALAAYLAVNDEPQSRDFLTTLIWPEFAPERGRRNLRRELSVLRSEVSPELIAADRSTVALGSELDFTIDVREFVVATEGLDPTDAEAARSLSPAAVERLQRATELHQLRFLEGFSLPDSPNFDDWQYLQAEELERRLAILLQVLIQYSRHHALSQQSLAYGQRWLELDRLNETAHRSLIEDYARAGQWTAAQRQFERCVELLDNELGIEPETETLDLARQIRERRLDVRAAQPASSSKHPGEALRVPDRLPVAAGRLVGRQRELTELQATLSDTGTRLVTLVGPGGIGKTRLALSVAALFSSQEPAESVFSDGVALVELAALDHPAQLLSAMAAVLGVERRTSGRGQEDLLVDIAHTLRRQEMLIVLDNFEHLIETAGTIATFTQEAPGVTFLVTSRERLDLRDEHIFRVDGLDLSGPVESEHAASLPPAADFFVQRARMADHGFELNADNADAVAQICQMLDGMPLAIELAAARLDLFSTPELAAEIERDIGILEARARDIPARQRSMQAVFDSSWEQLSVEEQAALVQLSVFRGGFSREAAEVVASATVPILERLSARSLIRFERLRFRFQIHELMRQYLSAKLESAPDLANAAASQQSAYYCRWIAGRVAAFKDSRQSSAVAETRGEFENVRVAWDQAVASNATERIDLATEGLALFLELEGRILDGWTMMEKAASALRSSAVDRDSSEGARLAYVRALAWQCAFDRALGNTDAASEAVHEIVELTADLDGAEAVRAFALLQTGTGRFTTAATESAADYLESVRLFRAAGERWGEGLALAEIGRVAWSDGDLDGAERWYQESLEIFRDLGNQREIANVLGMLSQVARYQARSVEAVRRAEEMLALTRESGSRLDLANALGSLGGSLYFTGEFEEAARLLAEADQYYQEFGTLTDRASALMRWGRVEGVMGNFDAAYAYSKQSRDIYDGIDLHSSVAYIDAELASIELARGQPGPAAARIESHLSKMRGMDRPTELSIVLGTWALIHYFNDECDQATAMTKEALEWALVSGANMALIEAVSFALPILTTCFGLEGTRNVWRALSTYPWLYESVLYRTLLGDDARLLEVTDRPATEIDPTGAAQTLLNLLSGDAASSH